MNGHSQTPNPTLRQMICTRLITGSLFPLSDGRAYAGKGTGKLCTVCSMPICAPEVENEVAKPQTGHAHSLCHSVWVQESLTLQESRA
jgi:hypothetical protein